MNHTKLVIAMAALSVSTVAQAVDVKWNSNTANALWGTGTNWVGNSAPTSSQTAVFDAVTLSSNKTFYLNGDQTVNDIKFVNTGTTARTYTISSGTPSTSKLTLLSGNFTYDLTGSTYLGNSTLGNLGGSRMQFGDGVAPVNAQWTFTVPNTADGAAKATATATFGEIITASGTVATISGSANPLGTGTGYTYLTLAQTSNNWLGKIIVNSSVPTEIISSKTNAFGTSQASLDIQTTTVLQFGDTVASHDADINIDATANTTISATGTNGVVTLNGDITGSGRILINKRGTSSTNYATGTIVFNGGANAIAGGVEVAAGTFRVNGTWTGSDDILVYNQYTSNTNKDSGIPGKIVLDGTGSIGLSNGSVLTLQGNNHNTVGTDSIVAPGTLGTVGTLTVGTDSSNSVVFLERSQFIVDVNGATADRLTINGNLNLNHANDRLIINVLAAPTEAQYVLASWTGTLSGTFNDIGTLPDDYELQYTSNQLLLVNPSIPEPASIAGLALLGGLLARRRR